MPKMERKSEQKRLQEEQLQESSKIGKSLRKLERNRTVVESRNMAGVLCQDRIMNKLNAENTEKLTDVNVAKSSYYKRQDKFNQNAILESISGIHEAGEQARKIKHVISMVQMKEKEIYEEIKKTSIEVRTLNVKLDTEHVVRPEKVERRMEIVRQQYGTQLTENKKLRELIEHLKSERDKVRATHHDIEKKVDQLSKELQGDIDIAKTTYDQRDFNKRNMEKLKNHLSKSKQAFDSDMNNVQFHIDVLRRMERFITTKNKFRPDDGKERRHAKANQLSARQEDTILYSEAMDNIRSQLSEDDIYVVIKTFVEMEQENYMLFKNNSETRDTCHTNQKEVDGMKSTINDILNANDLQEQEHAARLLELEEKILICRNKSDQNEKYISQADEIINTYIKGVLSMLDNLGYTEHDIQQISGALKCVEERNIREFLGEIEHYVNKLYNVKTSVEYMAWARVQSASLIATSVEQLPPRIAITKRVVVVPPQLDENDEIVDADGITESSIYPLSRDEVTFLVDEALEKKVKAYRGKGGRESLPPPSMEDSVSKAIGNTPHSPIAQKATNSIDIF